jgi:hypothetical protein
VASQWLNSSRPDFVNNNPDDNNPDATNGCTTLFLWYLFDQLRFDPHSIVAAGSDTLAGVYHNLTGRSDAFGAFSALVNSHFPPGFTYNPAGDSIFPVPELAQFFAPNQITTGYSGSTMIFIDRSALAEVNIALISDDPTLVQVPATVTIPIGATSTAVTISSTAIPIPFPPPGPSTSTRAMPGGSSRSASRWCRPAWSRCRSRPTPSSLATTRRARWYSTGPRYLAKVVTAGFSSQGTVTLRAAVPTSTRVGLAASDLPGLPGPPPGGSTVASVPNTIIIPAGQTTGSFTITTNAGSVLPGRHRGVKMLAAAVNAKFALLTVTP